MESIIGFIFFALAACGMGYLVYTRIMKKRAEKPDDTEKGDHK